MVFGCIFGTFWYIVKEKSGNPDFTGPMFRKAEDPKNGHLTKPKFC
jgi:hypothetical protein